MPNIFSRLSSVMKGRETKTEAAADDEILKTQEHEDDTTTLQRFLDSHQSVVYISIGVFGSSRSGKKCLMCRLTNGIYTEAYDPCEDWNYQHNTKVLGHSVGVMLSPYNPLASRRSQNENAFYFIAYNVGSRESFDGLQGIYERVLRMHPPLGKMNSWCGGTVVALASDLASRSGAVNAQVGRDFAQERGLDFMETSAKSGFGCTEADFMSMTTRLLLQAAERVRTSTNRSPANRLPPPPVSQFPPLHPPIASPSAMDWPTSTDRG